MNLMNRGGEQDHGRKENYLPCPGHNNDEYWSQNHMHVSENCELEPNGTFVLTTNPTPCVVCDTLFKGSKIADGSYRMIISTCLWP